MLVSPSGVANFFWLVKMNMAVKQQHLPVLLDCGIFFIGLSFLYFALRSLARPAHSLLAHTGCDLFLLASSLPRLARSPCHPSSVGTREQWSRMVESPRRLVEDNISTVPKC